MGGSPSSDGLSPADIVEIVISAVAACVGFCLLLFVRTIRRYCSERGRKRQQQQQQSKLSSEVERVTSPTNPPVPTKPVAVEPSQHKSIDPYEYFEQDRSVSNSRYPPHQPSQPLQAPVRSQLTDPSLRRRYARAADTAEESPLWDLFARIENSGETLFRWHVIELSFHGNCLVLTVDRDKAAHFDPSWQQQLSTQLATEFNTDASCFEIALSEPQSVWVFLRAMPCCSDIIPIEDDSTGSVSRQRGISPLGFSPASTVHSTPEISRRYPSSSAIHGGGDVELTALKKLHPPNGVITVFVDVDEPRVGSFLESNVLTFRALTCSHVVHHYPGTSLDPDFVSPSVKAALASALANRLNLPAKTQELNALLDPCFRLNEFHNKQWMDTGDRVNWYIPPYNEHAKTQHGELFSWSELGYFGMRREDVSPKIVDEDGFLDVAFSRPLSVYSDTRCLPLRQQPSQWLLWEGNFTQLQRQIRPSAMSGYSHPGFLLRAREPHIQPITILSPWKSLPRWWEYRVAPAGRTLDSEVNQATLQPVDHHVHFKMDNGQHLLPGDCGALVVLPLELRDNSLVLLPLGILSLYDMYTHEGRGSSMLTVMSFFLRKQWPTGWQLLNFRIHHPAAPVLRRIAAQERRDT